MDTENTGKDIYWEPTLPPHPPLRTSSPGGMGCFFIHPEKLEGKKLKILQKRSRVFATNSDFLISIAL